MVAPIIAARATMDAPVREEPTADKPPNDADGDGHYRAAKVYEDHQVEPVRQYNITLDRVERARIGLVDTSRVGHGDHGL